MIQRGICFRQKGIKLFIHHRLVNAALLSLLDRAACLFDQLVHKWRVDPLLLIGKGSQFVKPTVGKLNMEADAIRRILRRDKLDLLHAALKRVEHAVGGAMGCAAPRNHAQNDDRRGKGGIALHRMILQAMEKLAQPQAIRAETAVRLLWCLSQDRFPIGLDRSFIE